MRYRNIPALVIFLALVSETSRGASVSEVDTLRSLFTASGGNGWTVKDGWSLSNSTSIDACTWFGVYCNAAGNIVEINLRRNNLGGNGLMQNFSALTALSLFDVSYNSLTGSIDESLFALPSIQSLRLGSNRINAFPPLSTLTLASTLSTIYLSVNSFACPILGYTSLSMRLRQIWVDVNATSCVHTRTKTHQRTMTAIIEPPVRQVVNDSAIQALLVITALNGSSVNITAAFLDALGGISRFDGLISLSAPVTATLEFLSISVEVSKVWINFTNSAPIAFRNDVASRFKIQHVSVAALLASSVIVVDNIGTFSIATTSAPPTEPPTQSGISSGGIVAILVVGIVLVLLLFSVASVFWCRRRMAFTPVHHIHAMQQQQSKGTFARTKSLRMGTTAKLSAPGVDPAAVV